MSATGAFLAQHVIAAFSTSVARQKFETPWWFWLVPLRSLVRNSEAVSPWLALTGIIAATLGIWLIVSLSVRRAETARLNGWVAILAVAPALQALVILWYSVAPARPEAPLERRDEGNRTEAFAVAQGVVSGIALTVAAVALSTLMFRTYGYMLFIMTPAIIGLTTGYTANRRTEQRLGRTLSLMVCGLAFGGLGLLVFALEGFLCILFAGPLALGAGALGAAIGRHLARGRRARTQALMSIAALPLFLLAEAALPPRAAFESIETIDVNASPAAVWDAVVHMGPIPEPPAAPFRWGLAYPVDGQILGSGVGALRRGVFSTGVAYERITEWSPGRKLSFIVLSDPPMMQEMSPYPELHPPHRIGYFRTLDARFTLTPLGRGKTRLTLATRHELDLEPALYWLPITQWATQVNKRRVLGHFARQAEAAGS